MRSIVRRGVRRIIYSTPLHRWLGFGQQRLDGQYWDRQLAGAFKPYLGGTIAVEVRNTATLAMLRIVHPTLHSVLDVGCASESLARSSDARGLDYTGVDISTVAIEEARRLSPGRAFHAARLEDHRPDRMYDTVIFNEVLYYLPVEEAVREYRRYAAHLETGGLVVISMKHDPKSEGIMRAIVRESTWVSGLLTQEKKDGPGWSIRVDAARPAYMIGIVRPG